MYKDWVLGIDVGRDLAQGVRGLVVVVTKEGGRRHVKVSIAINARGCRWVLGIPNSSDSK